MDNTNQPPQVLSLCSGMCGLERGIESAIGKLNVVAYVEIEAFIIQNLTALMEQGVLDPAPVWSNLKTFPAEAFHRKLHGIIGGYPCQPFSVAGKQQGDKDPRHLWPHIQRIIETTNPVWCFFENVEGHLQLGYDQVYRSLRDMGYTVESNLFTASEVGAPHKRTRLFILAVRTSELGNAQHYGHATGTKRGRNGKDNERSKEGQNMAKQFKGASELENPNNTRNGRGNNEGTNGRCQIQIEGSSKLDNPSSHGQQPVHSISTRRNGTKPTSEKMANACKPGLQRFEWRYSFSRERETSFRSITKCCFDKWPLGPGFYQQPWEAPRTIESGMGSTVNGYNFREDLLRMYGNGVVEQTAQLAWITLWNQITNL